MCGRFVQVWDEALQRYVERFVPVEPDALLLDSFARDAFLAYNVAPTRLIGIIQATPEGPRIAQARWGFPLPGQNKDVFNTRLDNAASPFWRELMTKGRSITPAQGFYEWPKEGSTRTPMYIYRQDRQPMLMASVSGTRNVGDSLLTCSSILTCEPDRFMRTIHDRMPVILEPDQAKEWLTSQDPGLISLIATPREDFLAAHEVDSKVNKASNHGPDLTSPAPPRPGGRQSSLF